MFWHNVGSVPGTWRRRCSAARRSAAAARGPAGAAPAPAPPPPRTRPRRSARSPPRATCSDTPPLSRSVPTCSVLSLFHTYTHLTFMCARDSFFLVNSWIWEHRSKTLPKKILSNRNKYGDLISFWCRYRDNFEGYKNGTFIFKPHWWDLLPIIFKFNSKSVSKAFHQCKWITN